jgi:DNA-binding NarL/FixJ family response regulator
MEPIRTLIADDHRLFAESLQVVLDADKETRIEVVGIAADGDEAVSLARALKPDVVLMDVRMPGMDGVEATRVIHSEMPSVRIIMLTTFEDDDHVRSAIGNGATGYILKTVDISELTAAIRAVNAGSFLMSPGLGVRLAADGRATPTSPESQVENLMTVFPGLTRREAEVLELVVGSFDNREIADRMGISEHTVKNYTSSVYAKLGVRDRVHAIRHVHAKTGTQQPT